LPQKAAFAFARAPRYAVAAALAKCAALALSPQNS
jgi:hypothetical protein